MSEKKGSVTKLWEAVFLAPPGLSSAATVRKMRKFEEGGVVSSLFTPVCFVCAVVLYFVP